MILWRIAAETRTYSANDLSGLGAAAHPGRWNDIGQPVVYAAPTIAMAMLETAAHIDDAGLPLNRFLVRIEVPDAAWAARTERSAASLPVTWCAIPAGRASIDIGAAWLRSRASPILAVPSAVVPEETIVLLNPAHDLFAGTTATAVRPVDYNRLLRRT